ncbi:MAG: asparagine--tRNA ligase [Clostridia bacterium]|nr:asparagine--tRNA ligase [Clostridia bacterium]
MLTTRVLNKTYTDHADKVVTIGGWVRTIRDNKGIAFVDLNDGAFKGVQIVLQPELDNFAEVMKLSIGSSLVVTGQVKLTPGAQQPFEIVAQKVEIVGECAEDYPFQRKQRATMETLREIPELRARTNTFNAVFNIRSKAAYAIHKFFNENGFVYLNTPIITGSDCEGAGEMFQVTTLDLDKVADTGKVDYSRDFFGKKVGLTVSGQLQEECFTHAFGRTYTFGPTFRAENSNTTRHAAEFWMMEPEMCFTDLKGLLENEEAMLKYVINYVLDNCADELNFLNKFVDKELLDRLHNVVENDFVRLSYTEAIELLKKADVKFEYPVEWGTDLQSEHERYITEKVYKKPVFLYNYPKEIKAFYMRLNEDGKTVAAADLLVPGIGELCGGSQREERYDKLVERMKECGMVLEDYKYYTDIRRFGTTIHSGYGLGFERLVMYLTGMTNIRDVELMPRTVGSIKF